LNFERVTHFILDGKLRKQLDKFVDIFKELIEEFESKLEKIVIDFRENAETNIIISRSKWLIVRN